MLKSLTESENNMSFKSVNTRNNYDLIKSQLEENKNFILQ